MNIKDKFIELTSKTYPYKYEINLLKYLPNILKRDKHGNYYCKIGKSDVMFASHLDNACNKYETVYHVFDGYLIKSDGSTILGADDKSGVVVMLNMIENNIPGLYYFFIGEEKGLIGSKKLSKTKKIKNIKKVVSFDRSGYNSIITHQSGKRTASDEFGNALAYELNKYEPTFSYETDDSGVSTDSRAFEKIYPECTNISMGYDFEHTSYEEQDIEHLEKLAEACLKINWNSLPVKRDQNKNEYVRYSNRYPMNVRCGAEEEYLDLYYNAYKNAYVEKEKRDKEKEEEEHKYYFFDVDYNYVSEYRLNKNNEYTKIFLSKYRIGKEKENIRSLLTSLDIEFNYISWDGMYLSIFYNSLHYTKNDRNDLIEFLPELDYNSMEKVHVGGEISDDIIYNELMKNEEIKY